MTVVRANAVGVGGHTPWERERERDGVDAMGGSEAVHGSTRRLDWSLKWMDGWMNGMSSSSSLLSSSPPSISLNRGGVVGGLLWPR